METILAPLEHSFRRSVLCVQVSLSIHRNLQTYAEIFKTSYRVTYIKTVLLIFPSNASILALNWSGELIFKERSLFSWRQRGVNSMPLLSAWWHQYCLCSHEINFSNLSQQEWGNLHTLIWRRSPTAAVFFSPTYPCLPKCMAEMRSFVLQATAITEALSVMRIGERLSAVWYK